MLSGTSDANLMDSTSCAVCGFVPMCAPYLLTMSMSLETAGMPDDFSYLSYVKYIATIQTINENVMFTAPSVSQRAAIHALRNIGEVQPRMISEFKKRTFYAAERICAISGMHVLYPPAGTFYLWVNIMDSGMSSAEMCDGLLRKAHVLTIPGTAFGRCGEGYIRIACTVSMERLKEAFDRIERMMN